MVLILSVLSLGCVWLPFLIVYPELSVLSFVCAFAVIRIYNDIEKFEVNLASFNEVRFVKYIDIKIRLLISLFMLPTIVIGILLITMGKLIYIIGGIGFLIYAAENLCPVFWKKKDSCYFYIK